MARYPRVRLQLIATDHPVDLIAERIDLALRVRVALTSDAALTMRSLGTSDDIGEIEWHLERADGVTHRLRHQPRMTCSDFTAVRAAAIQDRGVAMLPDHVCSEALRQGLLVHLLPEWRAQMGIVHLVFTTRRGLPSAVRALIDHLAATFPK
ncbi:LysR substrate-binding domain-containing protein [Novosphingobium capsulatum]|uniref:LysR substrate-binding domain-containing protein n=1 Tax=Novosphingobium capsulatum TaxID=13688 RepID=UPI000AEE5A5B|nr:LysR substrate-binding domain-containing protein [Novosphingobium capsulatum]